MRLNSAPLPTRSRKLHRPALVPFSPEALRKHPGDFAQTWFAVPSPHWLSGFSQRLQNSLFNSALRQSTSIRKDLDAFAESNTLSPALLGELMIARALPRPGANTATQGKSTPPLLPSTAP